MQAWRERKFSSKRTGALLVDTPVDGRSIASQPVIRKMGMKMIGLQGKIRFSNSALGYLLARSGVGHWRFAGGAAAGVVRAVNSEIKEQL